MNMNAEQAAPNLIKNQNMDGGVSQQKNKRDRSSNRDSTFDDDF